VVRVCAGAQGAVEARFTVALPARGRSILGQWAAQILCQNLPRRAARPRFACSPERAPCMPRALRRASIHMTACCPPTGPPKPHSRPSSCGRTAALAAALPRRRRSRTLAQRGPPRNSGAPQQVRARGAALRVAGRAGRGGACGVRGGALPRCARRAVTVAPDARSYMNSQLGPLGRWGTLASRQRPTHACIGSC